MTTTPETQDTQTPQEPQTPEATAPQTEALQNAEQKAEQNAAPEKTEKPKPKYRITLSDEGRIFYQPDITNPLPGADIGALEKGEALLSPKVIALDGAALSQDQLEIAVQDHLENVLHQFFKLTQAADGEAQPVTAICQALYSDFGMLERASVQAQISQLDNDMRTSLRAKGVRFGPLYLYCPEMNKPAALRLRALLWALFHGLDLPATRVPDGMVSKLVDAEDTPLDPQQKALYSALCYPVYGGRAIRIDMLDRIVNAVYENANQGKFQAQHSMAEWLGCPILDLYKVLESLGHKKIHDPADALEAQEAAAAPATPKEPTENTLTLPATKTEQVSAAEAQDAEPTVEATATATVAEKPAQPAPKPELATFALKRGRANESAQSGGKKFKGGNKNFKKDGAGFKKNKSSFKGKKGDKKNFKKDNKPRVISSGPDKPSLENSPFAVLGQLKK